MTGPRFLMPLLLVVVLLAGCGGSPGTPDLPGTPSATTGVPATPGGDPPGELPGEPFEGFAPFEGDVVAVVGVSFDDVLNVRALPGAGQDAVGSFEPLADDVVATGRQRRLPGSIWTEVEAGGGAGWVNRGFLAYLGDTRDLTSEVVRRAGGEIPSAGSMEELGRIAAEQLTPDEPGADTRVVMVTAPTTGDVGEVTYDLVGLADDAQRGERLRVFGAPQAGGVFSLRSVEATLLCDRGTSDGLCV